MNADSIHWSETDRLALLDAYGILDTPQEKDFDDVVRLAADLLDVPMAAVNLIAGGRQWFKSEIGLGVREMPLDDSICKFALLQHGTMVIPDTRADARFACNPLVMADSGIRFYAGELLMTREGMPLGTLCVLGHTPRPDGLTEAQAFALKTLARQIMSQIELRRVLLQQQELLAEQARAEQALREADRKKDEFLAMLAHELRNPLAPIASAAHILSLGLDPARTRQAAAIVARQARHMDALIEDLLDVSRVTRGKISLELAAVDIKEVVADAVEQTRPLVEKHGHHLSVALPPAPALVRGDRKRLVQVITNVLSNAAKYTPDGGRIAVGLEADGEELVLAIADNGIGMTPDLLDDAFALFSQGKRGLDRSQGGLGIGLALVRSLLELHGGSIRAESEGPDRGSRFIVRLPRAASGVSGIAPAAPEGEKGPALRVAVVDDNDDAAATLALCLESFGHEVRAFHGAAEALRTIPEWAPDVCLLDIGMPEMDGHALVACLRGDARLAGAVFIAVTGYGQDSDRHAAARAGFDDLLVKPVDLGLLRTLLASHAGRLMGGAG